MAKNVSAPTQKAQKETPSTEKLRMDGRVGPFLGVGATKLIVVRGKKGFLYLICKKKFQEKEVRTGNDRWVYCKSLMKTLYSFCLAKAKKCSCGALGPVMKLSKGQQQDEDK